MGCGLGLVDWRGEMLLEVMRVKEVETLCDITTGRHRKLRNAGK